MILESVVCDYCNRMVPLRSSMVPDEWVTHDGQHYCCLYCFTKATGPARDAA